VRLTKGENKHRYTFNCHDSIKTKKRTSFLKEIASHTYFACQSFINIIMFLLLYLCKQFFFCFLVSLFSCLLHIKCRKCVQADHLPFFTVTIAAIGIYGKAQHFQVRSLGLLQVCQKTLLQKRKQFQILI